MIMSEFIKKLLSYVFPEFSNKLTWSVLAAGIFLISTPLWKEIIIQTIYAEFDISITDGNDSFVGLVLVALAIFHNLGFKYIESKRGEVKVLDLAKNISHVRELIDRVEDFDEVKESSWWGFIESNLTVWEKQYLTPPAISNSFGVAPGQLSGDPRKKQIVSEMLARIEIEGV